MPAAKDLLESCPGLDPEACAHLQLLLSDWQILADLSFADLLLFVRHTLPDGRRGYRCVGQMRPYTAQTIYHHDMLGEEIPVTERPMVGRALEEGRVIRDADPDWSTGVPVREEAIPVRLGPPGKEAFGARGGEIIAVVTREANVSTARSPSQLELTYLQAAGRLAQMLADGTFPYATDTAEERELSPRVGDGIITVDEQAVVTYASPNAISAYRRLGSLDNVEGQHIGDFDLGYEELLEAFVVGEPIETEVERRGATVLRRLLPMLAEGGVVGGLMLVREVTDLRRHERALRIKDATIREIHHRVKNNLQTVASLLRLQGRRLQSEEAREALAESVRRISSIALVHETLSQNSRQRANFERVARRIVHMLADGLVSKDSPVDFEFAGSPGDLPAEIASPLALVLAELLQNCVEHAFGEDGRTTGDGRHPLVRIVFERGPATLHVVVRDNGVGLPEDFALDTAANLGLQIARTLVESELGGTFNAPPPRDGEQGTIVELLIPLP